MKRIYLIIFCVVLMTLSSVQAAVYQWSVPLTGFISPETNEHPTAFLWIPENCTQVRAVVFGQHNMCEEPIFDHPVFRETMAELDFAIVWLSPGIDQQWDVKNGCQNLFDKMLEDLADVSGYSEINQAPVVPLGHSAMATFPWNFGAWNPDRTLAIISYHGDAPRTNLTGYGRENLEWGRNRNIDGIPALMVEGEYEWWEARVNPALAFRMMYPGSCISFLCDAGHGHFDVSDEVVDYLCLFLKKAAKYRLQEEQPLDSTFHLNKLNPQDGWLAERWHPNQKKRAKAARFLNYKGDPHDAFWYFDKEMAGATEGYYARERGKREQYIGFMQNGGLLSFNESLHARTTGRFEPEADGLTFHLKAAFTDTLRSRSSNDHASGKPVIDRICGPVEKVNDSTFTVRFYRMGLNNSKRTGDIWLLAHHPGDNKYKSSVQQFNLHIPIKQEDGEEQTISFSPIPDQVEGVKELSLTASSSSGLPVYFYVKEGSAEVENGKLIFREIPPKARFPVKVTVVAWQYGRMTEPKIQSAVPAEQSFFIQSK
ncbi:hypothetical protein [Mangrovibacterium marinum]|uniref:Uncharacterized protein n=1 Tax=Mangrovibacterium marinum TaxID=1639118 RepID=A0A2T5C5C7_9BACT|nr:hypothetical protein [Mangrovibacterium marinum]PTN10115.1 hypothetical protein C8N47_102100 [Mangrovibacterium marinum]